MTLNLAGLLSRQAALRPAATALICGDRRLAYGEVDAAARRLSTALARRGLGRGRALALMLPNTAEFTLCYFAAHTLGAPVVPLNVGLVPDEIAYHLTDSEVSLMVAVPEAMERAAAGIDRTGRSIPLLAGGMEAIASLIDPESGASAIAETAPDDTAVILYTSGTTGRPKGAELTHFNLHENARVVAGPMLGLDESTVALCALPLFHSFGQTVAHNAVLMSGGAVALLRRFEERAAAEAIARHGVTFFAGVPTMYIGLRRAAGALGVRLAGVRLCVSGGAPMPVEVLRGFEAEHGVTIRESYGLSETSPVASFNRLDRPARPGSIGVPIEGVEFRLAADDGAILEEPAARGEILIRGPNVMKGYHRRPEATAEAIQDGWLRTGDIARRDEDGYYFIVDRRKDVILRAGYTVYPREIEEVLFAHPGVAEAAVVGMPHPEYGEEIKAVVVLKEGADASAAAILEHCRRHLAGYKSPRVIEFRDQLPRGPSGKILKRALRG